MWELALEILERDEAGTGSRLPGVGRQRPRRDGGQRLQREHRDLIG